MEACKYVINYNTEAKTPFEIIPIGDIHLGDTDCDIAKLKETINYIKKTPRCYTILMGDMGNYFSPNDKRFDSDKVDILLRTPEAQFKEVIRLFKPIRHKIIAVLEGNHEANSKNLGLFDFSRNLAHDLECNYGGYACFIELSFRRQVKLTEKAKDKWRGMNGFGAKRVVIFATHGSGCSGRVGSKMNKLEEYSKNIEADIYLQAHNHSLSVSPMIKLICNKGVIIEKNTVCVNTGTFLKTWTKGKGSYAENKGYLPAKTGVAHIYINPRYNILTARI